MFGANKSGKLGKQKKDRRVREVGSGSGVYLKGGAAAASSSLPSATITATQSGCPSGCACSWCFAAPPDPSKLSSSRGASLAGAGKPTSCTLTLTSWRVVSLVAGLL